MKKGLLELIAVGLGIFVAVTAAQAQGQGQVGSLNYATPYGFATIAGSAGQPGTNDDANANARFYSPAGVALDTNGNVYVVDQVENTVRKMARSGTNWAVTTIAGTAGPGGAGSTDSTGHNILFNGPTGIAADRNGNLYVVDSNNSTVRKLSLVDGNWVSSTIAGTAGNPGSNDGTNGAAQFYLPQGIAADAAGNLYVADTDNNAIRRIAASGTNWLVTTIAGVADFLSYGANDGTNQNARFNAPYGLAVDNATNIFVADTFSGTVRKITPIGTNWVVTTIAGDAGGGTVPAPNFGAVDDTNGTAQFYYSYGIAVDTNDNLYVADSKNNLIRKISPVGTNWVTTTLAGSPLASSGAGSADGTGTNAAFNQPWGIAVDIAGNVLVGDSLNNTVRMGTVQILSLPNLSVSLTAGSVVVSWPGTGGTLQTNADLSTANWGVMAPPYAVNNGTNSATFSGPAGTLFFRLSN